LPLPVEAWVGSTRILGNVEITTSVLPTNGAATIAITM